jgi:serine/threonine protein phosphatase PrpC
MQTASKNYHYMNAANTFRETITANQNPFVNKPAGQPQSFKPSYMLFENKIVNDFNYMKPNIGPKGTSSRLPSQQERVINFGQDSNENNFKRNLRKPILQNNSISILGTTINTFNPYFKSSSYTQMNANNGQRVVSPKGVESIFLNYNTNQPLKGTSSGKLGVNNVNLENSKETDMTMLDIPGGGGYTNFTPEIPIVAKEIEAYRPKDIIKDGENGFYAPNCISVKEYAYRQDPNIRFRPSMEDFAKCIDVFNNDKEKGFFSIYDGHGGADVVKYVKDQMPEIFTKLMAGIPNDDLNMEKIIVNAFHKMDEELKQYVHLAEYMGCTASIVYIGKEKDLSGYNNYSKVVYAANVGDSRVVLVTNFGAKRLTYDHKASDYNEANRIRSCGGIIFNERVFGQLILTRALGDLSLKRQGVIPTPYVSKYHISDKDKYIVMASDGVWDVLSDEDMFLFSKAVRNSDDFAKIIVNNSLMRGSRDNISVTVIKLN